MSPLKNRVLFPEIVLRLAGLVPPYVVHNLAKANALKIAFWHQAVDGIAGAYVEFGVASGNSLRAAEIAERRSFSKSLGVRHVRRRLYAMDTFEAFSSRVEDDSHPTWTGSMFSVSLDRVQRRFRKCTDRITIWKQDANELTDKKGELLVPHQLELQAEKVAIVLFDMDLGEPTFRALMWIHDLLQEGALLLFDEYFAFGGHQTRGESYAISRYLTEHPDVKLRTFGYYGDGGVIYQFTQSQ